MHVTIQYVFVIWGIHAPTPSTAYMATYNRKSYFFACNSGAPALWPLDFAHPAYPIAMPLSYARSEKCTDCMHCAGSYSIVGVSGQHVLARIT